MKKVMLVLVVLLGGPLFAMIDIKPSGLVSIYSASPNMGIVISRNGYVGIGTTAPASKLEVAGTVSASALVVNGTLTANAYVGDGANLSNVSKYKFAVAQFDTGTNTKTISDGFCDANSWVQIEVQGVSAGRWIVVSSVGSFTITSTVIEPSSVEFIYRIMKQ